MDKFLTILRTDGSLDEITLPVTAPPKTPDVSPEKLQVTKAPMKRKAIDHDNETEPEGKLKTLRSTVRTLMQPMLATTLYLCSPCSTETRAGKNTALPNGKTSIPVVMCERPLQ